jgi:hypothetical protein
MISFSPVQASHITLPNWPKQHPLSAAALVDNDPRALRVTNLSVRPALRVSSVPLLTPGHDAHGIPGDIPAGPGDGRGTIVAPTDPAVQAAGELHARVRFRAAFLVYFSQRLDLALNCFGECSVAKVVAALGSLVLRAWSAGGWSYKGPGSRKRTYPQSYPAHWRSVDGTEPFEDGLDVADWVCVLRWGFERDVPNSAPGDRANS